MNNALGRGKVEEHNKGKAQESDTLPTNTLEQLNATYRIAWNMGLRLGPASFAMLVNHCAKQLAAYEQELKKGIAEDKRPEKTKAYAFAIAFGLERSDFYRWMSYVESRLSNNFNVQEICMKNLKKFLDMSETQIHQDFKKNAKELFESINLRISVMQMACFYYVVITTDWITLEK